MSDHDQLVDRISCDLKRVNATLQQHNLGVWLKLDISMAQFKALATVDRERDGISVTELGRRLSICEPSASLLVDQLVKRAYVQRQPDPADRRRVLVTTTDLGAELLGELRHGRHQQLEALVASISTADAEALARGLHALAEAAGQEPEKE